VFFVKSEEELTVCPNCGCSLIYHSRVQRKSTDITGKVSIYSVRVLKCGNRACPSTYHRELPNIMLPYKRYDTESIEDTLTYSKSEITVSADESTIQRWRKWFAVNAVYIIMALLSTSAEITNGDESFSLEKIWQNLNESIKTIKKIVMRETKWLNETVRILVNSAKWVFNRSAYGSG